MSQICQALPFNSDEGKLLVFLNSSLMIESFHGMPIIFLKESSFLSNTRFSNLWPVGQIWPVKRLDFGQQG